MKSSPSQTKIKEQFVDYKMECKFVYVTRTIDPESLCHYLDAIDNQGRHWTAEMSHQEEKWIVFTKPWKISSRHLYD